MLIQSNNLEENEKSIAMKDLNETNIIKEDDKWYYNDNTFVTNSHLKILMEGGPEALEHYYKYGSEDKEAYSFGRAFHTLILEPLEFNNRYFIFDDREICKEIGGARPTSTNKYKEWKENLITENVGKEIISLEDMNTLEKMEEKLYSIPQVITLLNGTKKEVIYQGEINGVKCKGKLDIVKPNQMVIDLKTTSKAPTPEQFFKDFRNFNYDRQMAFYTKLANVPNACIIAIQKTAPYTIGIYMLSKETIDAGIAKYEYALDLYKSQYRGNLDIDKFYYQGSI